MREKTVIGVFSLPLLFVLLAAARDVRAQAWVPFEGELNVALAFQRVDSHGHFLEGGDKLPGYRTRASNVVVQVGYGITERLAMDVFVPFVNVKYRGPEEPLLLPLNVLDDGAYHGTIADLRLDVRYNLIDDPIVVTPFAAFSIPSHAYDTLGEAAPGRDFQEFPVGVHAGRLLDPFLTRAFVQGTYSYTFVRQDVGIPLNYTTLFAEGGYFVTHSIPVSFFVRSLWTHGGLSFNELFEAPPEVFVNLDRVVRISYTHVGLSTTIPLTETLSANASYVWFVSGVDTHYGGGFNLGLSWTFQTRAMPILFPTGSEDGDAERLHWH